jgi:hypothetical protein
MTLTDKGTRDGCALVDQANPQDRVGGLRSCWPSGTLRHPGMTGLIIPPAINPAEPADQPPPPAAPPKTWANRFSPSAAIRATAPASMSLSRNGYRRCSSKYHASSSSSPGSAGSVTVTSYSDASPKLTRTPNPPPGFWPCPLTRTSTPGPSPAPVTARPPRHAHHDQFPARASRGNDLHLTRTRRADSSDANRACRASASCPAATSAGLTPTARSAATTKGPAQTPNPPQEQLPAPPAESTAPARDARLARLTARSPAFARIRLLRSVAGCMPPARAQPALTASEADPPRAPDLA